MRWTLAVCTALVACGDDGVKQMDASVDTTPIADVGLDAPDPNNPATLADTGLCLDAGCTQISPDVFAFEPHGDDADFELERELPAFERATQDEGGSQRRVAREG